MSEHLAAEIWIGGKVPTSLVPDLCVAISSEHVSGEWGDRQFRPESAEDLIRARDSDGHLRLCDDEARWGEFEGLEAFLQEYDIPFRRRSEGRYDLNPELVEFRPGQEVVTQLTDAAGQPVVPTSEFVPIQDLLSAALELHDKGSAVDAWSLVATARGMLREHLPSAISSLEPLEIVDDANHEDQANP